MAEDKFYNDPIQEEMEEDFDWAGYARTLWNNRKLLFKVAGIAAVVGAVFAFTTPRIYTVNVTLAPELGNSRRSNSLTSIASMLGVGGAAMGTESDALNVTLYPDVVTSTPFIIDLLDTPVRTLDEEEPDTTLIEYMRNNKSSLIGTVMSLPAKAIGGIISLFKEEEESENTDINPFHLTKEESKKVKGLRKSIAAQVDKKTGFTSISVTMQDPLVAAIVADTLLYKLKEHIISYRISKAEEDCIYYEKLYKESQENYHLAQKAYAEYADANKNVILRSVQIEGERLMNEMSLAYNLYSQMASQYQMGRAKVQEAKPMFAVVEPPTVPLLPSGMSRKMILIVFVFLAVAGASAWILFGKDYWIKFKEDFKKEEA